jgi:hypothetical protein
LVVGIENMTTHIASGAMAAGPLVMPHGANIETDNGRLMPAVFALLGRHHMDEYGTTAEQFAKVAYEDLGFCPKGEGGRFIDEGLSGYGGIVVVNPSGGLLSKGHPIGATGVAQLVEVVWQLQGVCGKRQVPNAKVGLTHNGGGFGPGNEPGAMVSDGFPGWSGSYSVLTPPTSVEWTSGGWDVCSTFVWQPIFRSFLSPPSSCLLSPPPSGTIGGVRGTASSHLLLFIRTIR